MIKNPEPLIGIDSLCISSRKSICLVIKRLEGVTNRKRHCWWN